MNVVNESKNFLVFFDCTKNNLNLKLEALYWITVRMLNLYWMLMLMSIL